MPGFPVTRVTRPRQPQPQPRPIRPQVNKEPVDARERRDVSPRRLALPPVVSALQLPAFMLLRGPSRLQKSDWGARVWICTFPNGTFWLNFFFLAPPRALTNRGWRTATTTTSNSGPAATDARPESPTTPQSSRPAVSLTQVFGVNAGNHIFDDRRQKRLIAAPRPTHTPRPATDAADVLTYPQLTFGARCDRATGPAVGGTSNVAACYRWIFLDFAFLRKARRSPRTLSRSPPSLLPHPRLSASIPNVSAAPGRPSGRRQREPELCVQG